MRLIRSTSQLVSFVERLRAQGRRIGLVPTMGALHEGHVSLIRRAAHENDVVIVTIFVNPLQFGPREDFARYPRTLKPDLHLAQAAGADVIFAPSVRDIYPPGFEPHVEPGVLAERWEGKRRPGHFRGVATVVAILFDLTRPTHAYFGRKDYQQALIVQRVVREWRLPLTVHILPTVREPDGLAMSSRNAYLTAAQRKQAVVLSQAFSAARAEIRAGERRAAPLIARMRRIIQHAPDARVDYAAIADAQTLKPVHRLRGRVVILLAAWIGRTRLIDNLLVDVS